MKVVAFNGSARKGGNTAALINHIMEALEKEGIETEAINLAEKKIQGCKACYKCFANKNQKCVQEDDMNECIQKMIQADAIIIGSPTYFANVSTETKALIDRAGLVARGNNNMLKRKIGAAVVAVRRAGGIHVFNSINHFFLINEMIIPGSSYWNIGIGLKPGEVEEDEEGIQTMHTLTENLLWAMKKLQE